MKKNAIAIRARVFSSMIDPFQYSAIQIDSVATARFAQ
jgi:hypothetical protein